MTNSPQKPHQVKSQGRILEPQWLRISLALILLACLLIALTADRATRHIEASFAKDASDAQALHHVQNLRQALSGMIFTTTSAAEYGTANSDGSTISDEQMQTLKTAFMLYRQQALTRPAIKNAHIERVSSHLEPLLYDFAATFSTAIELAQNHSQKSAINSIDQAMISYINKIMPLVDELDEMVSSQLDSPLLTSERGYTTTYQLAGYGMLFAALIFAYVLRKRYFPKRLFCMSLLLAMALTALALTQSLVHRWHALHFAEVARHNSSKMEDHTRSNALLHAAFAHAVRSKGPFAAGFEEYFRVQSGGLPSQHIYSRLRSDTFDLSLIDAMQDPLKTILKRCTANERQGLCTNMFFEYARLQEVLADRRTPARKTASVTDASTSPAAISASREVEDRCRDLEGSLREENKCVEFEIGQEVELIWQSTKEEKPQIKKTVVDVKMHALHHLTRLDKTDPAQKFQRELLHLTNENRLEAAVVSHWGVTTAILVGLLACMAILPRLREFK